MKYYERKIVDGSIYEKETNNARTLAALQKIIILDTGGNAP